ncbi:CBS domain-containing protein [Desulfolithobacter sp.]
MLQAKDIMTREVITVAEDLPVKELAKILSENRISGAPVLDEEGQVVGVVTESDLIDQNKKVHIPTVVAILDSFIFLENPEKMEKDLRKMAGTRVGDIFTRELIAVTPDTPLDEIATLMSERGVHTLPVMEGDNLVGVIGKSDIIRTIYS